MERAVIETGNAPAAIGPYVQAVRVGDALYASGQLGIDPATDCLPQGVEQQACQSLNNLGAILDAAGYERSDVVKTTVFLTDMASFAVVNEAYAAFFGDTFPARSCVQVAALPKGGLVEIEAVAVRQAPLA